ncbi:cytochrome c1 [Novosphingobium sp. TH158]|uniref:cytochrome c1 n=1 Tax=Novosphingobium sp. TH158 TaxID=2067455 RepID=UPI000C7DF5CC|nr:cytochrome c1 [Novosphingobium sp. TH158]PLK27038.1 cytochrome c1 [Novosphingobium sp. TH158]
MIRILSILVGLFFSVVLGYSFVVGAVSTASEGLPKTVEAQFHKHPEPLHLSSDGVFGRFDNQQLQRGFKVYQEVCQACHSLRHVAFRDLKAIGYNDDEVKAIAKTYQVPEYNKDTGEVKTRPGLATDKFPPVLYAGQGVPPDLSLITKARHGGAAYVHSLLLGYQEPPANLPKENRPGAGLHYNPYFANLNIAMPAPLTGDGQVTYTDGTKATKDQISEDVSAFLVWTAEPKQDKRRQTGWAVLGFLLFATVLAYMAKRQIWADKH